jgi:hypothetical protein
MTGGTTKEMRFLVTNIGQEDVLLGYLWLTAYEPRFSWCHGTIDEKQLPIILRTINPTKPRDVILHYLSTDEREKIVAELQKECGGEPPTIRNAAVELAVAASNTRKRWTSHRNTKSSQKCSARKNLSDSPHDDLTTMQSNSNPTSLIPSIAKYTL